MAKTLNKRIFSLITSLVLAIALVFSFTACGNDSEPLVVKDSDTCIVITASNDQMALTEKTTLLEYMNSLKESGKIEFTTSGSGDMIMVASIYDKENAADWSECWMLYTSDADNANSAWGTVEYNGNVYGSAVLGAATLKVKEGCLYIWVFKSMQ